ncbi:MAG: hypothetical protein R3F62_13060 [Planctomycetota bacterium]
MSPPKRYSERRRLLPPRLLLGEADPARRATLVRGLTHAGFEVVAVADPQALHAELARPLLEASVRSFAAVVVGPSCASAGVLRLAKGARARNTRLQVVLNGLPPGSLRGFAERLGLEPAPELHLHELTSRLSVILLRPHARRGA